MVWARAELLPPTLSSAASTSLLHVGFPNLSTYKEMEDGGVEQPYTYNSIGFVARPSCLQLLHGYSNQNEVTYYM